MDANQLDAISLLPQEVLGDILSLLPTKLAVSTSVLSKKWRNVFVLVHNLDFDDSDFLKPEDGKEERDEIRESFKDFVYRTLALQSCSPIKKFSLKCHIYAGEGEMASFVSPCICNAVERGVLELDLSLQIRYNRLLPGGRAHVIDEVFPPCELLTSKTLVKLTLGTKITLEKIPTDVSLPALKSLSIYSVFFNLDDLSSVLLPGCPVLEELSIHHDDYNGRPYLISSRTIKKLSVYYDTFYYLNNDDDMSFDAPSLVFLDYSDYALAEYPHVNLESLVEARLDIRYCESIENPDVSALIIGMSNVETLHLSPASARVISRCVAEQGLILPVFNNLVKLSFGSKNKRGWKLLLPLLKQAPKLETLIIQGLDGYTGDDVTMRPFQVKVLHVAGYGGTIKELERLESFLGGTESLQVVRVEFPQGFLVDDGKILQTQRDLMTILGVAASTCKTEVASFVKG